MGEDRGIARFPTSPTFASGTPAPALDRVISLWRNFGVKLNGAPRAVTLTLLLGYTSDTTAAANKLLAS